MHKRRVFGGINRANSWNAAQSHLGAEREWPKTRNNIFIFFRFSEVWFPPRNPARTLFWKREEGPGLQNRERGWEENAFYGIKTERLDIVCYSGKESIGRSEYACYASQQIKVVFVLHHRFKGWNELFLDHLCGMATTRFDRRSAFGVVQKGIFDLFTRIWVMTVEVWWPESARARTEMKLWELKNKKKAMDFSIIKADRNEIILTKASISLLDFAKWVWSSWKRWGINTLEELAAFQKIGASLGPWHLLWCRTQTRAGC